MKRVILAILVLLLAAGIGFAAGAKEAPKAAAKIDLQKATWDQIVAAAKAEGEVTFMPGISPIISKKRVSTSRNSTASKRT
jgi:hypothetical protein